MIRSATAADLEAVMRLAGACIDGMREHGIEQWDEIYPSRETLASDVAAGSLNICAVGDDLYAAIFVLDANLDPMWQVPWRVPGSRIAVVHRLMVHPRHQGRGLARRLMEHAERMATERGCDVMRLDCFSMNPQALRLYQSLGYRDAGTVVLRKGVFHCFEKSLG